MEPKPASLYLATKIGSEGMYLDKQVSNASYQQYGIPHGHDVQSAPRPGGGNAPSGERSSLDGAARARPPYHPLG